MLKKTLKKKRGMLIYRSMNISYADILLLALVSRTKIHEGHLVVSEQTDMEDYDTLALA